MIYNILFYSFITFIIFFLISKISYKLNLVDIPNKRKDHLKPTAYTGGIGISLAYIISIILFDFSTKQLGLILSISFLIAMVGFIDDKYQLNIGGKLSLQIIPIIYLILLENFSLNNIGEYNYFILELGTFQIPFSLLCVLFLINAFNYFDGLDGTLGFTTISVLGILYYLSNDQSIRFFIIITLIPIIIFLFFNFSIFKIPKIFLGDSGSLLLGFIISFFLIYLANQNFVHPILLAWSVAIFVYEFLSINLLRLKNKKNLFRPGHDHLHHILLKKIKSIYFTSLIIAMTNFFIFFIGYLTYEFLNSLISLLMYLFCFIIFYSIRNKYLI